MNDIPNPTLKRFPLYYNVFCNALQSGKEYLSSAEISEILAVDETQVRKDIAMTGYVGKPKVGFHVESFVNHMKTFLGLSRQKTAVVIGAGNLGIALARHSGFRKHGLEILALFDTDPHKIGLKIADKEVLPISQLPDFIRENGVQIAILSVPETYAQDVADGLAATQIRAIWNFAPINLNVPERIFVWNQDLEASFLTLAILMAKSDGVLSIPAKDAGPINPEGKEILYMCMGSACHQHGSYYVLPKIQKMLDDQGLSQRVELKGAFCLGHCAEGIVLKFRDQYFIKFNEENVEKRFKDEILPLLKTAVKTN